jgi:hypothetical protein
MRRVLRSFTGLSDESSQLVSYVKALRGVASEALYQCISDYILIVTLRVIDPHYSQKYIRACLRDGVEFKNFFSQIDSPRFRSRHVWRAWHYIRELVVKYIGEGDSQVKLLDTGAKESTRFQVTKFIGGLTQAEAGIGRPTRKVTKEEWRNIPQNSRNELVDRAIQMHGYEEQNKKDWGYDDVFASNPQRLLAILT